MAVILIHAIYGMVILYLSLSNRSLVKIAQDINTLCPPVPDHEKLTLPSPVIRPPEIPPDFCINTNHAPSLLQKWFASLLNRTMAYSNESDLMDFELQGRAIANLLLAMLIFILAIWLYYDYLLSKSRRNPRLHNLDDAKYRLDDAKKQIVKLKAKVADYAQLQATNASLLQQLSSLTSDYQTVQAIHGTSASSGGNVWASPDAAHVYGSSITPFADLILPEDLASGFEDTFVDDRYPIVKRNDTIPEQDAKDTFTSTEGPVTDAVETTTIAGDIETVPSSAISVASSDIVPHHKVPDQLSLAASGVFSASSEVLRYTDREGVLNIVHVPTYLSRYDEYGSHMPIDFARSLDEIPATFQPRRTGPQRLAQYNRSLMVKYNTFRTRHERDIGVVPYKMEWLKSDDEDGNTHHNIIFCQRDENNDIVNPCFYEEYVHKHPLLREKKQPATTNQQSSSSSSLLARNNQTHQSKGTHLPRPSQAASTTSSISSFANYANPPVRFNPETLHSPNTTTISPNLIPARRSTTTSTTDSSPAQNLNHSRWASASASSSSNSQRPSPSSTRNVPATTATTTTANANANANATPRPSSSASASSKRTMKF